MTDDFAEANLMHNALGRLIEEYVKFMKRRRCLYYWEYTVKKMKNKTQTTLGL